MPTRVLALLACAVLSACGAQPRGPRPSVVLVLVDQLRQDAADRWMEETCALAERGVRFEEMRSVAPWTYPSVISLLSGLHPQQHGADASQDGTRLTTISRDVPLLPRSLRAAGYHTAAFVTNPFLHEWNRPFRECFEHFDASFIGDQGPQRGHPEKVWTKDMYADTVNRHLRAHFDARPLTGPEFVYVHYIDVHGRKEGPERWLGAPFEPSYEGATRFVDGKIKELHDYFTARYGGELLFVVTSDHGQDADDDIAIGEGPPLRMRKNSLHDFNLRIPLYVLPGAPVPAAVRIQEPCTNVDVAPTLLEWLALPQPVRGPGTSLLAAIHGAAYDGESRTLYARNSTNGRFEESALHARRKLIRYRDPASGSVLARRLFDLAADPREAAPLRADMAAAERRLDEAADPGALQFSPTFEAVDAETQAELDALGYGGKLDEGGAAGADEPRPR